jgi:hypothetical protein
MQDNSRDADIDRRMETWADSQSGTGLSAELRRRIQRELAPSLTPVKPVPSESRLVLAFLTAFAAACAGLIAMMSKVGFHLMTGAQMGWMLAILFGGGILFSLTLAWRMIPGSRPRLPFSMVLTLTGVAVITGIAALFPWRTAGASVSEGWQCAVTEIMIAIPASALFWLLARRGALFASAGLGAALTGLAVLLALVPLQFQCMFQEAPHLLVWHGGTAILLIGLGALGGAWRSHRLAS